MEVGGGNGVMLAFGGGSFHEYDIDERSLCLPLSGGTLALYLAETGNRSLSHPRC